MHKCQNSEFRLIGNKMEFFGEWILVEVKFCPLCGKNLQPEEIKKEDSVKKNFFPS